MNPFIGMKPGSAAVPAEFRPLHAYLSERYADVVVLTFDQIEDLLGAVLPTGARNEGAWWDSPAGRTPSTQSATWTAAHRSAEANVSARKVTFERDR